MIVQYQHFSPYNLQAKLPYNLQAKRPQNLICLQCSYNIFRLGANTEFATPEAYATADVVVGIVALVRAP